VWLYLYLYYLCITGNINIIILPFQTEAQAIFLDPFIVCSSCKWKFVVRQFVDEETNGSYLFANRLNGLAHLCFELTTLGIIRPSSSSSC
jgi:hypothetical protein